MRYECVVCHDGGGSGDNSQRSPAYYNCDRCGGKATMVPVDNIRTILKYQDKHVKMKAVLEWWEAAMKNHFSRGYGNLHSIFMHVDDFTEDEENILVDLMREAGYSWQRETVTSGGESTRYIKIFRRN